MKELKQNNLISSFEEYEKEYKISINDPQKFWDEKAQDFIWHKKWNKVWEWSFDEPQIKWFIGGKLNITENCLDRHLKDKSNQTTIIWEPNDPEQKEVKLSYLELHEQVCKVANILKKYGVKKGDKVCIYLPMIPETVITMLACARIGAIHSVVFSGFSAKSLADRINDIDASFLITADGAKRGEKNLQFFPIISEALEKQKSIKKVFVVRHTKHPFPLDSDSGVWLDEEMESANSNCPAEILDAEDILFILYTSGSVHKPKGIIHTIGGYMVYADYSFRNVFHYQNGDVYWCTGDVGWITGHTYGVYAPLLCGATIVMFEGIPTYPNRGRMWEIIDKYQINIFYTVPTAIRALMAGGLEFVRPYKLTSLKVLGSVGEPLNEEAWHWYNDNIGKKKCPIVDTWWQTETGGIAISPLATVTKMKPSYISLPLPGVLPILVDDGGKEITKPNITGNLCLKAPLPAMMRGIYSNLAILKEAYFTQYPGLYFSGDAAFRDEEGYYRITGRVDDVIKVSGHRIGTAEIEDAINKTPLVTESAVVGYPHHIKGEALCAFIVANIDIDEQSDCDELKGEIINNVTTIISPIAKPDVVQFVLALPKTNSGKILRRVLRKIAAFDFDNLGDTSTLVNPSVVPEIVERWKKNNSGQ